MNFGFDGGYSEVKAWSDRGAIRFPSVRGSPEHSRYSAAAKASVPIELLQPRHVLVGGSALKQSRHRERREDRAWIETDLYEDLFLVALTELTTASATVNVVTGLPVAFYEGDKEKFQDLLTRQFTCKRAGRNVQRFDIHCLRVVEQGFGILLSEVLSNSGRIVDTDLALGKIGVVDAGGKTCNFVSVHGMEEIAKESTSVDAGGWDVIRAVGEYIQTELPGLDLSGHEVAEAVQNGYVTRFGEQVSIASAIEIEAERLANEIISTATQLWNGGARLDAILVGGGGAHLVGKYVKRAYRHARVVSESPEFANAIGYWRLAQRVTS